MGDMDDHNEIVRVHVFVEGRVQMVWFRGGTCQEANRLGVRGWVRNLPDGLVEAVYEGERQAVEKLIAWTRRGTPKAIVTGLQFQYETPQGEIGFTIR